MYNIDLLDASETCTKLLQCDGLSLILLILSWIPKLVISLWLIHFTFDSCSYKSFLHLGQSREILYCTEFGLLNYTILSFTSDTKTFINTSISLLFSKLYYYYQREFHYLGALCTLGVTVRPQPPFSVYLFLIFKFQQSYFCTPGFIQSLPFLFSFCKRFYHRTVLPDWVSVDLSTNLFFLILVSKFLSSP